jgi:hypothetical protein
MTHLEYKIVLKEIYDGWYLKKNSLELYSSPVMLFYTVFSVHQFCAVFVIVTLFRGIFVICHSATRTTNLRHPEGLAAHGKISTPHAASQIPVVRRLA